MSTLGIHIADIRLYKSSEVAQVFTDNSLGDWDTLQSKVNLAGDNVHSLLLEINSANYKTNDDGTYEICVIPGTYDLLVDKPAYLDYFYINKTVSEGDIIDLGACTLKAGDLDKSGLIDIKDYANIGNVNNTYPTDSNYNEDYDFNGDLGINIKEISYVANNYLATREVIK